MTFRRRAYGRNHAYYDELEDGSEVKVPGVTTVLNEGIPKNLTNWAAESAASYAVEHWDELGGLPLLKRGKEIQYNWRRERDAAAGKGTLIHELAEDLARDVEITVPDEIVGHVDSAVKFLNDTGFEPLFTELPVINRTFNYAGTIDAIGAMTAIDGTTRLVDWKTGKSVYPESALQLCAYRHAEAYLDNGAERPMEELQIVSTWIVHIRDDGYELIETDSSERVLQLFRYAQQTAYWFGGWSPEDGVRADALLKRAAS